MYGLRQRYESTWNVPQETPPPDTGLQGWLRDIWWENGLRFEKTWDRVSSFKQAVDTSTSLFLAPARVAMGYIAPAVEMVTKPIKAGAAKIGLFPSAEADAEYALRENFTMAVVDALKSIKAQALVDTGIDITAAMVLYPGFLDRLACQNALLYPQFDVERACQRAGIETMAYRPMSDSSLVQWASTSLGDFDSARPNIIILDQGLRHFDVMSLGPYGPKSLPVEELDCTSVVHGLISGNPDNSLLLEEVERGASFDRLASEILRARALLKTEHDTRGDRDDDALEECPIDLDGWWVSDLAQPISLRWTDVKGMDDLYEDTLLDALHEAQSSIIQGATKCGEAFNATTDGVVILNSYCDASLMTLAIREAMGDRVPIFGPTSGRDLTYFAQFSARYALRERDRAVKEVEIVCQHGDDDEGIELWNLMHEEL
ncbi:hypothetical protein BJY00DRAFT_266763 [Aspergillus carlsbadensis]|nr:hypothetical protein BJY00DRAFT_266763 [Aspergillus carlsbadensis]